MYCRGVPETSMVNVPLAGQVLAPQPEAPESEGEPGLDASAAGPPSAVLAPLEEPLLPLD